ncbi:MAG TPA: ABC transporter substrate-binding protein [Candidatus Brocadiia bacterium]|nr:ABC transporter substrate-binding protein [Candidatus Brocadiia bacterium]
MDAEARARLTPVGMALLVARIASVAAAVAVALWLYLGYTPPKRSSYPGREKVIFWHMWTSNWAEVINNICRRFNESQERYEVVPLTVCGGSLKTLIATAGGDPPDCMGQWETVIPAWAERGALTPLDELMEPGDWARLRDKMYPAVREIGTYKGHFYGLATGMNIWACYYRPSHFKEAGFDPDKFPKTLEELDAIAEKLYRYDKNNNITRIGFTPWGLSHWIALFGGTLFDYDRNELSICHPRNIDALAWMAGYSNKYGYDRVLQFQAGLPSTMEASWPFMSGAYSIVVDGQWRIQQIFEYMPNLDYRTAPIPPPAGGKENACWSNGNFMIIPSGAKNKKGALEFMSFWSGVSDPARAAEFYTWGGWLPITPDVANAPIYQEYIRKFPEFKTFVDIMSSPNVQVTPPTPVQAYLMHRLGWAEDAARREVMSPKAALETIRDEVDRELKNTRVSLKPAS